MSWVVFEEDSGFTEMGIQEEVEGGGILSGPGEMGIPWGFVLGRGDD